ncbi:hypothetical protein [Bradyrhizobium ivorense]|uniref:hypothetical protein n=1 Tax=Bradyrhizobium ivorense TaxID=2511166 RepID=UPI00155B3235|nr:hypothetical protein [Bradyrhizobium ivorense]
MLGDLGKQRIVKVYLAPDWDHTTAPHSSGRAQAAPDWRRNLIIAEDDGEKGPPVINSWPIAMSVEACQKTRAMLKCRVLQLYQDRNKR